MKIIIFIKQYRIYYNFKSLKIILKYFFKILNEEIKHSLIEFLN